MHLVLIVDRRRALASPFWSYRRLPKFGEAYEIKKLLNIIYFQIFALWNILSPYFHPPPHALYKLIIDKNCNFLYSTCSNLESSASRCVNKTSI